MIRYPQFYRKYGIRQQGQLMKPLLHSINALTLPFDSIFHHLGDDGNQMALTDPIFQGNAGRYIMTQHVLALAPDATVGHPIAVPTDKGLMARQFHQKNLKFRLTRDYSLVINDPKMVMAFNYTFLTHLYRYPQTPLRPYYMWANHYRTMWENVAAVAAKTSRQQFIVMELPIDLAAPSIYQKFENMGINQAMLSHQLTNDRSFALADLWTWLGENREKSAIATVPVEHLNKVNLIWLESGHWTVINLGLLEAWRKKDAIAPEEQQGMLATIKSLGANGTLLDPIQLQRRVLRMWMSIAESRSVSDIDEVPEGEVAETPVEDNNNEERDEDGQLVLNREEQGEQQPPVIVPSVVGAAPVTPPAPVVKEKKSRFVTAHDVDLSDIDTLDDSDPALDAVEDSGEFDDAALERDLQALEKAAVEREKEPTSNEGHRTYTTYTPPSKNLEDGVVNVAKRMVSNGVLSAAQYRRMEQLSKRYRDIPNPYQKDSKLSDLMTISKAEIELPEKTNIAPNAVGVLDKSMLSSSLARFDRDYVREVLKKDVAKMVLNVQKAGVAVQHYDVERVDELHGSYEIHSVKIVPVVGAPTTLRFNLPIVDDNGTFKAKGVKYRMRKQRGDLPIRKISPSEVAMTSYYSKLFINRSERAVFNYPNWLINQITARAVDPQDLTVTDIKLGAVFDNDAVVPRTYSIIAMRCSEFKSGEYHFYFDYNNREKFFGESVVKGVESKDGFVPVGKTNGDVLIMDRKGMIYRIAKEGDKRVAQPLGTMEKLLNLDSHKAPIEIAEIGIFAKAIPLGFVLAHEAGLGNLLETLKLPYRREKTRSHYVMNDNEFDVRFEDETLIFKKEDALAQLIFGGFNRYHHDIKRFSIYHFDKKEAYATILDNNGMGARFIREMDLMFKMWVDHITEELLIEMGEPTDLFNLLISAAKKLETDDHPLTVDNLFMRDKGYERFAGLMYNEVVKSMRLYSGKPANAKATVDLNPYAVWKAVTDDATVTVMEDSNPLGNLSEKEVVVFRGSGGRSARSMTARHRAFHKNGIGVVSEATPDNGDTATITYLTADPNYRSLRGTIRTLYKVEGNAARVLSTSALMAPGVEKDD